jgi:iron complex outermembrane receptor protein
MISSRATALLGSTALALLLQPAGGTRAQGTTLPEIVVTSPSPILSRPDTPLPELRPAPDGGVAAGVLPVVTDTFSPVAVVPGSEIVSQQPVDLGAALFERPGISGSTYAPNAANRPIIRGQENFRVRVQENGINAGDVSALGEDHAVPISPLVQDRIEVIRGPATLRYGSTAIGGVVSAENNRIPTFIPSGGVTGRFLSGYSSVDNGTTNAASVEAGATGPNGIGGALHADGFYTKSDDYGTPAGRQFNSATRTEGGAIGYSLIGPSGFVGLAYQHYNALYHIPGGGAAASRTRLDPFQDKITARGEYRFDGGPFSALRFDFGASNYKHNERGLDEDGADGVRATFRNREVEGRVELQHVPIFTAFGTMTGAAGYQFRNPRISTGGEAGGLLRPTSERAHAGYLFEELDLRQGTRFQLAGRVEHTVVKGTAALFPAGFLPVFSPTGEVDADGSPALAPDALISQARRRAFMPMSAAFGVLQDLPGGFVASLTGQYVERAPAAPELLSRGAHDATATFEIGNPDLKLERARTLELGIRRAQGPIRFDATGYVTRYTGFIYKRLTGTQCGDTFDTCGVDTELQQVVYSQRNATLYGAEIGAQLDVIPIRSGFIGVDAQYDFVRARFDDGTAVPRIPPHRVGGGLFWREAGWFARIGLLHAFDHGQTAPFETVTPGWTNLKAEVSYTTPVDRSVYSISEFTLGVRGDNLLDDDIRNSASFKKDEILLPGRSARVFVSLRF